MSGNQTTWSISSKHNPFASDAIDRVPYRFRIGDWTDNLDRLQALSFHASIVGSKGTGKTTLLEQLPANLKSRFSISTLFQRIPLARQAHSSLVTRLLEEKRHGKILLVDCLERLSFLNRVRLMGGKRIAQGGLIVTCHRRCRLPEWIRCTSSRRTLGHVLEHLATHIDPQEKVGLWNDATLHLAVSNGNIREVLRFLYDRTAEGRYGSFANQIVNEPVK